MTHPPSGSGVDLELATMLEREVRAGAPPLDSVGSITMAPAREAVPAPHSPEVEIIDTPLPPPVPATAASTSGSLSPDMQIGAVIIRPVGQAGAVGGAAAGSEATTPAVGLAGELLPNNQPGTAIVMAKESLPPGPGVNRPAPQTTTSQPLEEIEKTIIVERLNTVLEADWQKALHRQIDDLYKQVAAQYSSPPANADRMLTMLQEARRTLVKSPESFVEAEYLMAQVRATLSRTVESRRQSARYGPRVFGYELGWLIVFLLGLVFAARLTELFTRAGNATGATANDLFPFWNTLMWGGIGGIVGALYALWWHVSEQQDFDRQYLMWYLVQPIMGLVLGGIVFLLLSGGFLVLQIKPTDGNAGARLLPYLVAVLAGFRQNFIYEQFDRLIALFTPRGNAGENKS